MVRRWVGAGMIEAERSCGRIKGCKRHSPDDPQGETLPEDLAGAMEALAKVRANVEILTTLAGATPAEPSSAHRKTQARRDFTDEQVAMLIRLF